MYTHLGQTCPQRNGVPSIWWIDVLFGKCLYTSWEAASAVIGAVSIVLWLVALLPQIYTNWRTKSTAGLSVYFVLFWLTGDTMGLIGCIVLNQQPFQVFLTAYFVLTDIALLGQSFWYRNSDRVSSESRLDGLPPGIVVTSPGAGETECLMPSDGVGSGYSSIQPAAQSSLLTSGKKRVWQRTSVRVICAVLTLLLALWLVLSRCRFQVNVSLEAFAMFLAWSSTIAYHASRLPQLWHNHKRQSVEGLSLTMFAIVFIANGTYSVSLLALVPVSGPEFLRKTASYIYGPFGSMFLDVFVLMQFYVYSRRQRKRGASIMTE
ncbi:hypothetical protein IWW38_002970 [Coemansia aciculifera]|uniref:Uncharacterized protein n=1 Tax=Coemansia aciculifera TaxID=417176 RepID=A0ACC1M3U3_9FUNG|nr:hypothetical protein IWW38_002970 [Coemansia aciculifera]